MQKLNITTKLTLLLLTTNKEFICYNLNSNGTNIDNYILTNDLYRYKTKYTNFKVLSCIKKQFNTITF